MSVARDAAFAVLLRYYRDLSVLSCNTLGRRIGVDPSYVSRLERGEREPPRRPICERLADALGLSPADTDRLLVAAGYVPASVQVLGHWDETLQEVADVLTDAQVSPENLMAFRQVVHLVAAHWRTAGAAPPARAREEARAW